ncbi:MAG: 3D domain-containing protein [Bacillota bacterium]|nr:3D domain-containing protein [Bacillota bacterium]
MKYFLLAARKALSSRNIKESGIRIACAVICATLSCTLYIYNALAFFTGSTDNSDSINTLNAVKAAYFLKTPGSISGKNLFAGGKEALAGMEGLFPIRIHAGREVIDTISPGETVQEILQRCGVELSEKDRVLPELSIKVSGETDIFVTQIENFTEEVLEDIPFDTVKRRSDELSAGESAVVQKGAAGQQKTLYEVYKKNGTESLRKKISSEVIKNPVTEIIEYGTGGTVTVFGRAYAYKKFFKMTASAYTTENRRWKHTASGTKARFGAIAVDPDIIPLGTRMLVTSMDGKSWVYGVAVAEDTGGTIRGNKIDLFFNTRSECLSFGIRKAKVYILG